MSTDALSLIRTVGRAQRVSTRRPRVSFVAQTRRTTQANAVTAAVLHSRTLNRLITRRKSEPCVALALVYTNALSVARAVVDVIARRKAAAAAFPTHVAFAQSIRITNSVTCTK